MSLAEYRRKRQFSSTPEPEPRPEPTAPRLRALRTPDRRRFCVQQHAASHLHYDLRLEMGGVLKSWAIPKGPTLDPEVKRLAMQTEDHPLDYLRFEGEIPAGSYGAGTVVVWDIGEYEIVGHQPPLHQWDRGSLKFILYGQRLRGEFALAQMRHRSAKDNAWLLIKKHDDFARYGDRAEQHKGSVISGMKLTSADPPSAGTGPVARRANPAPESGEFPYAPAARGRQTRHAPARAAARPAAARTRDARPSRAGTRAHRPAPAANAAKAVRAPHGVRRRKPAATSRRASAAAPRAAHARRAKSTSPQPPSALRAALHTGSAGRRSPRPAGSAAFSPLSLPGAVAGPMPDKLRPMLATLSHQPFSDPQWLYEIKWDGVRALAYCRQGRVQWVSRTGRDISRQYPELAVLGKALHGDGEDGDYAGDGNAPVDAVLDGEIVALDRKGRANFSRLQQRINLTGDAEVARAREKYPVVFYAFDLLYARGAILLKTPLMARKAWLQQHLATGAAIRYSDHVAGSGIELLALAKQRNLEGVMAKRADSAYAQGRSRDWLKFKLERRQEAVIVGYTDPQGSRDYFGSLLLAVYEPGERQYRYIGNVGTGFSAAVRRDLLARMRALPHSRAAVAGLPNSRFHPVAPTLVVEAKFLEWTPDGKMRAPAYLGLRSDKRPTQVVRE